MREQDEDAAWREIVANYGERARLEDEPVADEPASDPDEEPEAEAVYPPEEPPPSTVLDAPEERFVPPPPPPLPRPRGPRGLAWLGVVGSPLLLLVFLLTGTYLPGWGAWTLVVAFLGGFGYLVWTMPRGPRDPWDDGAQV